MNTFIDFNWLILFPFSLEKHYIFVGGNQFDGIRNSRIKDRYCEQHFVKDQDHFVIVLILFFYAHRNVALIVLHIDDLQLSFEQEQVLDIGLILGISAVPAFGVFLIVDGIGVDLVALLRDLVEDPVIFLITPDTDPMRSPQNYTIPAGFNVVQVIEALFHNQLGLPKGAIIL